MLHLIRASVIASGIALLSSACEAITGPGGEHRLGVLEWVPSASRSTAGLSMSLGQQPPMPRVSAPDTVQSGVPFTVVVRTIGNDNCWMPASTEVTQEALLATVTPYDRNARTEEFGCLDSEITIEHPAQVAFSRPGEAVLRVHGRRVVGPDLRQEGSPVTIEKRIHVR